MSIPLTVNGLVYNYPEKSDTDWGNAATDWASAISTTTLQKSGGAFALTADASFGSSFGLKSLYYKTNTSNSALSGEFRLAKTDTITFRNNANSADIELGINTTDELIYNNTVIIQNPMSAVGDLIVGGTAGLATRLAIGTIGQVLTSNGTTEYWSDAAAGDMLLAGIQTVTAAKTFNDGKLILAGATSGTSILKAAAIAGSTTFTLPSNTGTLVGSGDTGSVTNTMLAGSIDVTTKLSGAVPIANGGTNNASLAVTAGGTLYSDGSKLVNVGAGTAGQYLKSNGVSAPTWASVNYNLGTANTMTTSSSATLVAITGLTTTITTVGNPVELKMVPQPYTGISFSSNIEIFKNGTTTTFTGIVAWFRDSTQISSNYITYYNPTTTSGFRGTSVPCNAFDLVDFPSAGTYTYTVKWAITDTSCSINMSDSMIKLMSRELRG